MSGPPPLLDAPPAPPAARVFPNLRQTLLVLVLFVLALLGTSWVLAPLRDALPQHLYLFAVMLIGEGLVVLAGFRLARWPLRRVFGTVGFSTATLRRLVVVGAGTLLVVIGLIVLLAWAFGPFEQDYLVELFELDNGLEFLVLFLMVGVAAPVLEELLFRGLLLRGLVASWGATGGVLWTSFFFALIHLSPVQAVPAFVNGVVWGIVLLRTGSLGSVLFLHSLNNSFVFLVVQLTLNAGLPHDAAPEPLSAVAVGAAVAAATGGFVLLRRGLRYLAAEPPRLTAFWGLPAGSAPLAGPGPATGGAGAD